MINDIQIVDQTDGAGRFYVYVYHDARPGVVGAPIYVGKGMENKRYGRHGRALFHWHHKASNRGLQAALREMRSIHVAPVIEVVGRFETEQEAFDLEAAAIAKYGRLDLGLGALFNLSDGGEGPIGFRHTAAAKQKISASSKIMHSDAQFAARRAAKISAALSRPETRAVRSAIMREVHARPGDSERRKASQRAAFATEEHKRRRSLATQASFQRSETKAVHSSSLKRRWSIAGAKEGQSAAMKALHADPVHKKKHRDAVRAWFASPEYAARLTARRLAKLAQRETSPNHV